ncbi:transcription antitermination factor NusB [uncultured Paracoccus sp.]|uniref:RsmB/NOP family class I SAM-dependent RNA methyltransferase n=1 Tax=uncultured Paracoccus sp. TaxID=189685 RepID=UPI00260750B6|nr:transcription antitermination factor NusB [uncultured Paracoccus sp.]
MDKSDDREGRPGNGPEARPRRRVAARVPPPKPSAQPPAAADDTPPATARPERRKKSSPPGRRPSAARLPRHDNSVADARAGALALLAAVRSGATLSDAAAALDHLPGADRARAQRLAAETLRYRGRAEAVLAPLCPRRPRPEVHDILMLGTTEMLALAEAPHGVVNAAVALAQRGAPKVRAAAGMVNAVLRRAASGQAIWNAAGPTELPAWVRRPMEQAWGGAAVSAIEAAHERAAPLDLTGKPGAVVPGEPLPTGSHRLPAGSQVTALPGYGSGDWWVQDAAAALPVAVLAPRPGERIADLCAAPGGKTLQLAAAGARVTAVDLSAQRLTRVADNMARTGLAADLVAADALSWRPDAPLDAVLLDAPCSATGTIRRHPELPLIRDGSGIPELVAEQAALIDRALDLLRPGGRLVYAVCSLLPAEGEDQLDAALARHPDCAVEPPDGPGIDPVWITASGGLRLRPDYWPDRGGMDGFFIARLRRGQG